MQPAHKRSNRIGYFLFALSFFVIVLAGIWQRYYIFDQLRLLNYNPPAAIVKLADETTMLPDARRMFYAYHPSIEDKESFGQHCTSVERTIVLGCYVPRQGIYLYNVTDSRLHGVVEVTAAHEMLHAAYERLWPSERRRINSLLESAYKDVTDARVRSTIDAYRQNGADVPNEMHSILGTEVPDLPDELERYYARYFKDRQAVVKYLQKYESEFTSRKERVAAADAKLKEMKAQIESGNNALTEKLKQLNASYARLQTLKRSGEIEQYNAGVSPYNNAVAAYNADVRRVQSLIQAYNDLVVERNSIAVEQSELSKAIDSRPNTLSSE